MPLTKEVNLNALFKFQPKMKNTKITIYDITNTVLLLGLPNAPRNLVPNDLLFAIQVGYQKYDGINNENKS